MKRGNSEWSHAKLIRMVEKGDDGAMGELARRQGPAMLQFADQLLGSALRSRLDAEDLVQSVWVTIWLGIRAGSFVVPTPGSLTALAKTLLRRQLARDWRKLKSEINIDSSMKETVLDVPVTLAENGPYQQAEFEDLMDKLLSELTEADQALVRLRFRGFTTEDASVLLQTEPGHLRVRLGRLRTRLAGLRRDLMARA